MNGLLDDPRQLGLLGLALGMLEQGGPQRQPVSVGQALARGGMQGLGMYQQARKGQQEDEDRKVQRLLREMQMQKMRSEILENEAQAARYARLGIDPKSPAVLQIADALGNADPNKAALIREALRAPTMVGGVPMREGAGGMSPVMPIEQVLANIRKTKETAQEAIEGAKARYDLGSYTDEQGRPVLATRESALRSVGPSGLSGSPLAADVERLPPQLREAMGDVRVPGQQTLRPAEAAGPALAGQKAREEAKAKLDASKDKRASGSKDVLKLLDGVDDLIKQATGSWVGYGRDIALEGIGRATPAAQAIAKLKVLQTNLMLSQPRMEGPQSDRDAKLYLEAAGRIGDSTAPASVKRAAVQQIISLHKKYAKQDDVQFNWEQDKEERYQQWLREQEQQ